MTSAPTLETARLLLRAHRAEDFDALFALWTHPDVARYISPTQDRAEAWRKLLMKPGMWALMGFGYWAVEGKATGRLIGDVGFHDMRRELEPSLDGTMEAGWSFAPDAQGRGFALEAMEAVIGWRSKTHPHLPVTCIVDEENGRSLKLAARLGFRETARTIYKSKPILVLALETATPNG